MTKAEFRKTIAGKKKAELEQLLLDTFSASKEAQRLLSSALGMAAEDANRLIEESEQKI